MLPVALYCALLVPLPDCVGAAPSPPQGPATLASVAPASAQASAPQEKSGAAPKPEEVKAILLLHFAVHLFGPAEPAPEPPAGKPAPGDKADKKEPASKEAPQKPKARPRVRIGVAGDDDVARLAVRELPRKQLAEIEVEVVELPLDEVKDGKAVGRCDLLYLAESVDRSTAELVIAAYRDQPLALVCCRPGFAAAAGDIQPFLERRGKDGKKTTGRISFEMNPEALRRKHLRVPAQLMNRSGKGPVD